MMTIGFTASCFDLLHAGHILMLKEAKKHCDYLIVGLQTDPTIDRSEKNKPIQSITERFLQLQAVKYVDEIIPYDTEEDLYNLLVSLDYDIRILGEEYKDKDFTGRDLNNYIFNNRKHNYSSSSLRNKL